MSKEFFETMEEIEKISKKIKFWEGTHPEIEAPIHDSLLDVLQQMQNIEYDVTRQLKRKAKVQPVSKRPKAKLDE